MSFSSSVQVQALPQSIDEFVALRDDIAHTPQGGAAMMVIALYTYAEDENLGRQCLTVAVDRSRLEEGPNGYKGWQLGTSDLRLIRHQIVGRSFILRSYLRGASPENGYKLPEPPYELEFSANPYSGDPTSGTFKVFIACSGASTPRPVTLKRNNQGIWKAFEWSSLIVGVQAPVQRQDDPL